MKLRRRRRPARPRVQCHDGARWMPCHSTTCGHLESCHTPAPGGGWRCLACGSMHGSE